jgi:hypothetical protein
VTALPLDDALPGTIPLPAYLDRVAAAIAPFEFSPEDTFAAVSICRDELTQHLIEMVARRWHRPFALGGLGALPSLGRTGWQACLSHVPDAGGRGHLLVFGMPHIGVDPDGGLGQSLRRHQDAPTATCGAMAALLASLTDPPPPPPPGLDDHEAQRLRRVVDLEEGPLPEDLVALTQRAARAVEAEMWTELEALEAWREMDVAVFCGIQVHLPEGLDVVWPSGASFQGADGDRRPLEV